MIDHEDSNLATVPSGFDSYEDAQTWLRYLDEIAAQQDFITRKENNGND